MTLKHNFTSILQLILLFLITGNVLSFSQSFGGKIIDENSQGVIGASIFNVSASEGVISDHAGLFQLKNIQVGDTILISHLGYDSQNIVVSNASQQLNVFLKTALLSLDEIVITNRRNPIKVISDIDIKLNPVNSSQDILKRVPGLFIGQHAGGGKAEQIFLRGFDIDHGTDVTISTDGIPVNMVSHAHGQGYADLHFIIPETVEKIDFGKGPYNGENGNFNTAGFVNFETKESVESNQVKLELGQFNTQRVLGVAKIKNDEKSKAYIASEYLRSDGPFESPQNLSRFNIFGKYTFKPSLSDKIKLQLSHFTSEWDASGQIPQRAVDSGLITRFGAIDDTEGGATSRTNAALKYSKIIGKKASFHQNIFYSNYDFLLFSNFTFFLDDPMNGDQIKQKEDRSIYGFDNAYSKYYELNKLDGKWSIGSHLRKDIVKGNELSHTLNKTQTLHIIQLGNVNETNVGAYVSNELNLDKWTLNTSLRFDYFNFSYLDSLNLSMGERSQSKSILSPKAKLSYQQSNNLQLYLKAGKGFHTNDSRVVIAQTTQQILPAAYGYDLGMNWKPMPDVFINFAYWYLFLEQEFVYVGDAGIVEPSGQTRRYGFDLSLRYQPLEWLYLNVDANYANPRSIDDDEGNDFIPLAPDFTLISGLTANHPSGIYGNLNVRYLKDRPATSDNSIVAEGYTVFDLTTGYEWKKMNFGIQIQNLLNTEWKETQFATLSRLQDEIEPVEEIHFIPGTPFSLKGVLTINF